MKRISTLGIAILCLLTAFPCIAADNPPFAVNVAELTEDQTWWTEDFLPMEPFWENLERVSLPDETWFQVYQLPENIYVLFEPYQSELVMSYLILGEDSALLWDTGLGIGNIRSCVEKLTDLPVTVLNSHDHFDHIGGNAFFDHVMCYNLDSAIEALTLGVPHETLAAWIDPDEIINPPADFSPDTFFTPGKAPTATVEEGQIINLGNRPLEVLYTPGHCNSSIMLIDEQNGLLFTGDTWYPGWLFFFEKDHSLQQYAESMKKASAAIEEVIPTRFILPTTLSCPPPIPICWIKQRSSWNRF